MTWTMTWRFKKGERVWWVSPLYGTRYQIEIIEPITLRDGTPGYRAKMEQRAGTGVFEVSEVADDEKLVGPDGTDRL